MATFNYSKTYTIYRQAIEWNNDGTKTITLKFVDANGAIAMTDRYILDANNVYDRFGKLVFAQAGSFKTALITLETGVDSAITALEVANKFNPQA